MGAAAEPGSELTTSLNAGSGIVGNIIETFAFAGNKGKATVPALLDSGASASVIRRDVAERLVDSLLRLPARTLRMVNGDSWVTVSA